MTPEQFREIDDRFHEALGLPVAERASFLEGLFGRDPLVGQKVHAMLAADARDRNFMEAPAAGAAPDSLLRRLAGDPVTESHPETVSSSVSVVPAATERGRTKPNGDAPNEFGPYLLIEQLGRGGMGVVYRARHRQTGQLAALKTVLGATESVLSSLRREIRALARLRHPGIVKIFDEGVERGLPWYAMELLEGTPLNRHRWGALEAQPQAVPGPPGPTATLAAEDLHSRPEAWWTQALSGTPAGTPTGMPRNEAAVLASRARELLPRAAAGHLPTALRLVHRLCFALAYLHGEGLVHRDLKPANILVKPDDWPVLVDFGLMSQFSASEASREVLDISALAAGTLAYIAPEQAQGEFVDARADLYALGSILYELVCGRPPFVAVHPMEVLAQHLFSPPTPASQIVEDVPAELDALILKLLAKDRRHRLGYASDVATVLETLGAGEEAGIELPAAHSYLYRPGFGGRQEELGTLVQQLDKLRNRPDGDPPNAASSVVFVGGESGIGKTRLAMELAREAIKHEMKVLVGECLPTSSGKQELASGEPGNGGAGGPTLVASPHADGDGFSAPSSIAARSSQLAAPPAPLAAPLHPLRKPLQQIADRCREKGLAETERLLGPRGKVLAAYEPSLEGLPGQELHSEPPALPPSAALLRLYTALTDSFVALASSPSTAIRQAHDGGLGQTPLLLVLDDLQWADELTLGFVEYFLDRGVAQSTNVMLLATYRTDEVSGALRRLCDSAGLVKLELRRFDEATVASMIADMLALSTPPPFFSRHLARQSEGNAFFVAEYLRAAVGERLLWRDPRGIWQVSEIDESPSSEAAYERLPLPNSLRELIGRRLESLSSNAVQVLQAAAVLGREVEEALLAQMTGVEGLPAIDAIGEMVARQILEQAGAGRLRFVHDKIREVSYERIGRESRPALHRAAAVVMDGQPEAVRKRHLAALGHHWEQAGETTLARRDYLAGAGEAKTGAALSEAERLYRAYLRLVVEPDQESADALTLFGMTVLHPQGRNEEAKEVAQNALETARSLGLRNTEARSLSSLGTLHWLTRNLAEASTILEQALAIFRELGEPVSICRSLDILATVKSQQNARDEARVLYQAALTLAMQTGSPLTEGVTRCNLAILEADMGHWADARTQYERSLILLRQAGERRHEAAALANFGNLFRRQGQMKEAEAVFRQALELQRSIGDRRNEAYSMCNLADAFEIQARWAEARPLYERALAFGRGAGEMRLCILSLYGLSLVELADGAIELARARVDEALSLVRSQGLQALEADGLAFLARLERLGGSELAVTESLLRQAMSLAHDEGNVDTKVRLCCEEGFELLAAGRSAEAPLTQALGQVDDLNLPPSSQLACEVAWLERAQAAFASGEHHRLFRGELFEDLPEGLRRRLAEASRPA